MKLSLHLICIACYLIEFSFALPVPHKTSLNSLPDPNQHMYALLINIEPNRAETMDNSYPNSPPEQRIANDGHRTHHSKGHSRDVLDQPSLDVITPQMTGIREMDKRSPQSSPLATLLGTLQSTTESLPVVGVPLTSLLSSLPTSALTAPGAVTGLLGTVTGAAQSAPVLGDLLKMLPLSSILKGNPLSNLKNTLSGLFVAIPVLGGPLNGLTGAATDMAASSLPISLFDLGSASPSGSQRIVADPESDDETTHSTPLAVLRAVP